MNKLFTVNTLAIAVICTMFIFTSCKKEELAREKFLGTYSMTDACSVTGAATYTVTITASSADENKVLISNLWYFNNTVSAEIEGNNMVIVRQEPDGDDYEIQGNGTYSNAGDLISLNYNAIDPANNNDVCQGTLTKQ